MSNERSFHLLSFLFYGFLFYLDVFSGKMYFKETQLLGYKNKYGAWYVKNHCLQEYSGMSLGISVFDRSYELSKSLCQQMFDFY